MDYVPGESLQTRLERSGAIPGPELAHLGARLAGALAKAHAQNVIHRDIKPANIILTRDDHPVLVDFGIARHDAAGANASTALNSYTALFAAPEQMRKGAASVASDIYSLAATLHYALLYDRPECRGPDDYDPARVPDDWRAFFDAALATNPTRRYRDMAAVLAVLERLAEGVPAWTRHSHYETPQSALYQVERAATSEPAADEADALNRERETRLWQRTIQKHTHEAYQEYLDYCRREQLSPAHEAEAREAIEAFEITIDDRAWDEVQGKVASSPTPDAINLYKAYLKGETLRRHRPEAQQALLDLEERADIEADDLVFAKASWVDTPEAYRSYLDGPTLKRHRAEVEARARSFAERVAEDDEAFAEARRLDTPEAYLAYVNGPARQRHRHEVWLAVGRLKTQSPHLDQLKRTLQRDEMTVAGRRYLLDPMGTATDAETGLMWMRCCLGQTWDGTTCRGEARKMNWDEAMMQTGDGFAGYRDWRLPTIEELRTLVYCSSGKPTTWNGTGKACLGTCQTPTIAHAVFPESPATWFWSSSPRAESPPVAWVLQFGHGYDGGARTKESAYHARLVRGGK